MFLFRRAKLVRRIKTRSWKKIEVFISWKDPKDGREWTSTATVRMGILKQFLLKSKLKDVYKED